MDTKHYTSIEQSKKLLGLGLNPETSDMIYSMVNGRSTPFIRLERVDELDELHDVVCWSVGALLEVMPNHTELTKIDDEWVVSSSDYIDWVSESLMESVYEKVCSLLENGYIKKE